MMPILRTCDCDENNKNNCFTCLLLINILLFYKYHTFIHDYLLFYKKYNTFLTPTLASVFFVKALIQRHYLNAYEIEELGLGLGRLSGTDSYVLASLIWLVVLLSLAVIIILVVSGHSLPLPLLLSQQTTQSTLLLPSFLLLILHFPYSSSCPCSFYCTQYRPAC